MNFNPKYKKITGIILLIVIISLVMTGLIVRKLIKETNNRIAENWFFEESIRTGQPVILNNAFILSNEDGVLRFIYDYTTYEIDGRLAETYFGVANITVEGDDITKVSIKPDSIEDILVSYTEDTVGLKTNGKIARHANVPVYKVIDGAVSQVEWNSFVVGVSKIRCIMEQGQVSAILIESEVVPSDVRVVIKNGDTIFYPELYIKRVSNDMIFNISSILAANNLSSFEITDEVGLLICDKNGQSSKSMYEGVFRIENTESGMVLVNEVPMETYLKYVLPSEMQTNFAHEALKAQAVCARTYAYSHMKNQTYARYGANLDDTTAFQVYNSFGRYPQTDAAVEETKGEVITYNGELIACYYYSTSPGVTNDMSSWENENPEYIAVSGTEVLNGWDLQREEDFSAYMREDIQSFDEASQFYRWKAILDIDEIKEKEYGRLEEIRILERNLAGFVIELELIYEKESIILKNENSIRTALGMYLEEIILNDESVRTNMKMLPSACFEIVEESNGNVVLRGGGFGHGIGMSQYGAKGMAEAGYGYKEIISYYYHNVVVKSL